MAKTLESEENECVVLGEREVWEKRRGGKIYKKVLELSNNGVDSVNVGLGDLGKHDRDRCHPFICRGRPPLWQINWNVSTGKSTETMLGSNCTQPLTRQAARSKERQQISSMALAWSFGFGAESFRAG